MTTNRCVSTVAAGHLSGLHPCLMVVSGLPLSYRLFGFGLLQRLSVLGVAAGFLPPSSFVCLPCAVGLRFVGAGFWGFVTLPRGFS